MSKQRWQGDWTPQGQVVKEDKDAERRRIIRGLTRTLLAHGDHPSRVLTVVIENWGEVGREEALAVIEHENANALN